MQSDIERELITRLKKREKDAFSVLYEKYAGAMNGILVRQLNDSSLSDKILEITFISVWENFPQYDQSKGKLFTWMVQLLHINLMVHSPVKTAFVNNEFFPGRISNVLDMVFYNKSKKEIAQKMQVPVTQIGTYMRCCLKKYAN